MTAHAEDDAHSGVPKREAQVCSGLPCAPRAFEVRSPSGDVLSRHDNITSAVRANRLREGKSQVWLGDVAMTLPKGHVFVCNPGNPESIGLRRIRNWKGHRRYDPRAWQDPVGAECLVRALR